LNARYNRTGFDNPWFVIGVSYSGALSAWFRLKFPHLTCGSLASSGVVRAVYNYTDFDKQVGSTGIAIFSANSVWSVDCHLIQVYVCRLESRLALSAKLPFKKRLDLLSNSFCQTAVR